jgi:predicted secreted protein
MVLLMEKVQITTLKYNASIDNYVSFNLLLELSYLLQLTP